jgi:hypothetical protein
LRVLFLARLAVVRPVLDLRAEVRPAAFGVPRFVAFAGLWLAIERRAAVRGVVERRPRVWPMPCSMSCISPGFGFLLVLLDLLIFLLLFLARIVFLLGIVRDLVNRAAHASPRGCTTQAKTR